MRKWNSEGANPYATKAVVVSAGKGGSVWKVAQLNGQDVLSKNIKIECEANYPGNDRDFTRKLQQLINGVNIYA
jgi:hypothetical protein